MKIDQLRYFLETAKQMHVGRAANILAISPSAVSHSISELERELGRALFVKKGKNIYITNHGRLLMEKADRLIHELDVIKDDMAADNVELQGHYKFAASHLLCAKRLSPALAEMQSKHHGISCEVYTLRSVQVIQGVAAGEYDFGLCFNPQPHPLIESRKVYRGQLVVGVRRNHPLLKLSPAKRMTALGQYQAVLPKAFHGIENCEAHPVFKKFQIEPKTSFIFDSYDVAVEKILRSDAWCLLYDWMVDYYSPKLTSITAKGWNAPAWVAAVWPKHRLLTKPLKQLIPLIERQFKA